ncbi:MAG: DUF1311 domain-containing protein [Boseongicola sp.]|nr:DUF1311 domain-containing protein [Boseongicola sp.]
MALMGAGAANAEELSFTMAPTQACLADAEGVDRISCAGASAEYCMSKPAGSSTVGMGFCLGRELGDWDDRLNAAYAELRRVERRVMEEAKTLELRVPDTVLALRNMQRAWMQFRDATCTYEFSTWGGGTGGGPANTACLLDLTARQTLMLEDRLEDRSR